MIHTYDMTKMGLKLKEYRSKAGLTQQEVCDRSQVSRDTLRRIENGKVVPRYDTIINLSKLYRFDLLKLFNQYALEESVLAYYDEIDRLIIEHDLDKIEEIQTRLENIIDNDKQVNLVNLTEARQMMHLFHLLKVSYAKPPRFPAKEEVLQGIRLRLKDFEIEDFSRTHFNFIELRLLLIYGILCRYEDIDLEVDLLHFLLKQYDQNTNNLDEIKLIIRMYYNLSYNYYKADKDEKSVALADQALDFMAKKHVFYLKEHLLFRKGMSMYFLGHKDYEIYLKKSLDLLLINDNHELYQVFLESLSKVHKIQVSGHKVSHQQS